MKCLFSFLLGVGCGVGGTVLFIHKELKKQMNELQDRYEKEAKTQNASESDGKAPISNDMPFVVSDTTNEKNAAMLNSDGEKPIAIQKKTRTKYENLIRDNYEGELQKPSPNLAEAQMRENGEEENDTDPVVETSRDVFYDPNAEHWEPIDDYEFNNNPGFDKDELVFFAGDRVLATMSGAVIENGYILIGNAWESEVGHYDDRTAYIRNNKSAVDYAIYVEDGCYRDEYGVEGAPLVED